MRPSTSSCNRQRSPISTWLTSRISSYNRRGGGNQSSFWATKRCSDSYTPPERYHQGPLVNKAVGNLKYFEWTWTLELSLSLCISLHVRYENLHQDYARVTSELAKYKAKSICSMCLVWSFVWYLITKSLQIWTPVPWPWTRSISLVYK